MLTGRDTLFGTVLFVAPKAQGMVSLRSCCPAAPRLPFFIPFFRWLEANRADRETGQGRAVCARSSERTRRPLTRLPRSEHSPAKKWGDFTRFFVFKTFTRSRRAVAAAQQPGVEDFSSSPLVFYRFAQANA